VPRGSPAVAWPWWLGAEATAQVPSALDFRLTGERLKKNKNGSGNPPLKTNCGGNPTPRQNESGTNGEWQHPNTTGWNETPGQSDGTTLRRYPGSAYKEWWKETAGRLGTTGPWVPPSKVRWLWPWKPLSGPFFPTLPSIEPAQPHERRGALGWERLGLTPSQSWAGPP